MMTPERWQRLKRMIETALDREPSARRAYLEEACGGDASLRDEAVALVDAYEADPSFIEEPAIVRLPADGEGRLAASAAVREDALVGPYRLTRRIAAGGMGMVYEGIRADDAYEKKVAIKFIRPDAFLDSRGREQLLRRFRTERQSLADLDHPHVARLLDGGTTTEGLPFLVMEYIDGRPIDEYCETAGLDTVARLRLFRKVCDAVAYAHQHLIVHRDLKPGNILVTDDGTPKLLDFGLAKMLESDSSELANRITRTGVQPMTPAYASPEQIRGRPIGTATDIYSLGVILYELLTGQPPYRASSDSPHELSRCICEEEPLRPSQAVSRFGGSSAVRGGWSGSSSGFGRSSHPRPERLRRRLAGDVDNIVLRALRKEPERRYSSVEMFSEDIRRHLEGEPIVARKGTWSYRAGKFVRRHRLGVAFAALLLVTILAGSLGILWKASEAERRTRDAELVGKFWMDALRPSLPLDSDPFEWSRRRKKASVTIDEFLTRAAARLPSLPEQPLLEAEMRERLGAICNESLRFDQALPLFEEALVIRRRAQGDDHPDTLTAMNNVGFVLLALERWEPARTILSEASRRLTATLGGQARETLDTRHNLARVLGMLGKPEEAEAMFGEVVPLCERALPAGDPRRARILNNYGVFLLRRGKPGEAEPWLRQVVAIRRETLGHSHADTLNAVLNLASAIRLQERFAEALPLFQEAYEGARRVMGDEDIQTLRAGNNFGLCLVQLNRLDEAEALLSSVVEAAKETLPKGSLDVALFRGNYGECLTRLGRCREALPHVLAAQAFVEKHAGASADARQKARERVFAAAEACGDTALAQRFRGVPSGGADGEK